jgi:hypothetical protein
MFLVRSEQHVQESGPAARQAHDEERLPNFLSRNRWIKLPIPLHEQT